jgi:hypothetical protein
LNIVPLSIRKKDTWAQHFTWVNPVQGTYKPDMSNPIDLTGFTATLQVSASSSSNADVLLSITSPAASLQVQPEETDPDSPNFGGPILGQIALHVPPVVTDTLPARRCWYGLEVTDGIDRYTLAAGPLFVHRKAVA